MTVSVGEIMTSEVRTVGPELRLLALDRLFLKDKISGYPVVDDGQMVGVVSRSDIIRQLVVEQSLAEHASDYYRGQLGSTGLESSLEEIAQRIGRRFESLRVRDVMIRKVVSVSADESASQAAQLMVERRIHRLPVVDDGHLVGVLTTFDITRWVAAQKES